MPKDETSTTTATPTTTTTEAPATTAREETPRRANASAKRATGEDFQPIEPDDADPNPTFVAVPKGWDEVAAEGAKLADAEAEATGGVVDQFAEPGEVEHNRVWAMDAPHNVNLRAGGRAGAEERPDFVERR